MVRSAHSQQTAGEASRSEATCQRLLEAALRLFSSEGFDAVSTRALARAARVNQAAIPYHFGSKEGLYQAVAQRVVDAVWASMEPLAETIRARHQEGVHDLAQAREDVIALVLALLKRIVSAPDRHEVGHYIMREQMQPTAAMDILYDGMLQPLHELLGQLVAALRGKSPGNADVIVEVQALYGQAVVFGVHRATVTRRLGKDSLQAAEHEQIAGVVRKMILRQFPLNADEQPRT